MAQSETSASASADKRENTYVLVIHGTWNPPVEGSKTWHQLDAGNSANFCDRLNNSLARLGVGRPVWAHPSNQEFHFSWSGDNSHEARIRAADDLVAVIHEIEGLDPDARIHLVAHSHGCNVVVAAVQRYLARLRQSAEAVARAAIEALEASPVEQAWERGLTDEFADRAQLMLGRTRSLAHDMKEAMQRARNEAAKTPLARIAKVADARLGIKLPRLRAVSHSPELRPNIQELMDRWETSRETNRVASIVLLGAPFYQKRWFKRSWYSFGSVTGTMLDLVVASALGLGVTFLIILYLWGLTFAAVWSYANIVGSDYGLSWMGWHPLSWPQWLIWTSGFFLIVYAAAAWGLGGGWGLSDVNPYFDRAILEPFQGGTSERSALPYPTLIVHAGLLDEVLLAFSAEPIVYGVLGPHIRTLVKPELSFRMEKRAAGQKLTFRNGLTRLVSAAIRCVTGVALWSLGPLRGVWERYLTGTLLKIVSTPSFGLPEREFENAIIVPDHTLRRPDVFAEIVEDVGHILISAPSVNAKTEPAEDRTRRYAHLWDRAERDRLAATSWLWSRVEPALGEIARRHRTVSQGDVSLLRDRLMTTSLVLEQRMREFAGVVQLVHSSYYTNEAIIEMIGNFIATGGSHVVGEGFLDLGASNDENEVIRPG